MKAIDCFVGEGLKPKAMSLGFADALTPQTIQLESQGDVNRAREHVSSSDPKLLEAALKKKRSLFANAFTCRDFNKNDAFVALAVERGHAFEIPFSYFLRREGFKRSVLMHRGRAFLKKLVKKRVQYRITSHARNESELRSPRDLVALGVCLGLTEEQAFHALREE